MDKVASLECEAIVFNVMNVIFLYFEEIIKL